MSKKKTKSNIGKKVLLMAAVSILAITAVFFVCHFVMKKNSSGIDERSQTLIALNEIEHLIAEDGADSVGDSDDGAAQLAAQKVEALMESLETGAAEKNLSGSSGWGGDYNRICYVLSIASVLAVYGVVYVTMLRPFAKLEDFAGEIANGNLDTELTYERVHMFGQFTWAFDHMRREIKRARQCEKEAVENNKTVIATLSHDIKTPIASIRAYSEALEQHMDSSAERRQRYIDVIMRKCDEVTKITNDMFLHSLHDLDKLVMKKEQVPIHEVISETVQSMIGDKADVSIGQLDECTLQDCDKDRIAQVLENLISNARKYAPGPILVSGVAGDALPENIRYMISVKDGGSGIPDEDMPFIFEKFYRGKNSGDQPGAGLGLFIVKYIMEQMGGSVSLESQSDGLSVKLFF